MALPQTGMPYTVHRVRRALENSCRPIDGLPVLCQGRGLVQVEDAFRYLQEHSSDSMHDGTTCPPPLPPRRSGLPLLVTCA